MKKLYEFVAYRNETVEEKIPAKNEQGEEIIEIKKVTKRVPAKFFIRRPTRVMFDEAELFYGVQFSEGIKFGLMTRAQLAAKLGEESKLQQEKNQENYSRLFKLEQEFQQATVKKEEERSPEEKEAVQELVKNIAGLRREIQQFEMTQSSIYDHTAETRARNKTVLWWLSQLAYKEDEKPLLGEGTFAERLKRYDVMEENEDEFQLRVMRKFLLTISLWYVGRAESAEDFDKIIKEGQIEETPDEPKQENK
jgi:hypothetical protein